MNSLKIGSVAGTRIRSRTINMRSKRPSSNRHIRLSYPSSLLTPVPNPRPNGKIRQSYFSSPVTLTTGAKQSNFGLRNEFLVPATSRLLHTSASFACSNKAALRSLSQDQIIVVRCLPDYDRVGKRLEAIGVMKLIMKRRGRKRLFYIMEYDHRILHFFNIIDPTPPIPDPSIFNMIRDCKNALFHANYSDQEFEECLTACQNEKDFLATFNLTLVDVECLIFKLQFARKIAFQQLNFYIKRQ